MSLTTEPIESLAVLGGSPLLSPADPSLFAWPVVTDEDEAAVIKVLRSGNMSGWDITRKFEQEFAAWIGTTHALASCNGTSSLLEAMFAVGIGRGDELIMPSLTYWASGLQAYSLGATPVFADIDPVTLCIDPADIEHRITPQTRAIMVVHYCGHPCDMDPILAIAKKHNLRVIEDVSHAHGGYYKGRRLGSLGDISAMSMMAAKSFAIGEGGMLCTNSREMYERAIAFGHYERHDELAVPALKAAAGLPWGGTKGRLNQTCAAMGRVQLKYYDARIKTIQDAMNRFWDALEGTPGLRPHRTPPATGWTMGGWYNPLAHYLPEETGNVPVDKIVAALLAEGVRASRGANLPLHVHPLLNDVDVYHDGKPTRTVFSASDVRQPRGRLPRTERVAARTFGVPAFKQDDPEYIVQCAAAFRKVMRQAHRLIESQTEDRMGGIRDRIESHVSLVITAIVLIVAIASLAVYYQSGDEAKPAAGPTENALYTIDDGATWFTAPRQLPPFEHNGKQAVQAFVFRYGDREQTGYLMRCTPGALQRYASAEKGSAVATLGPQPVDCEVKRPGEAHWISMADPKAIGIMTPKPPPGASGLAQLVQP